MFLYDETQIINTASVQRFGFATSINDLLTSPWQFEGTVKGVVIAEFEMYNMSREILYKGDAEACQKFYQNLLKALAQGDRIVSIESLQPEAVD